MRSARDALRAVVADAAVAVALGEAAAVGADDQRQVPVLGRRREAEALLQQPLAMGRGEQVVAADDAVDPLAGVVDDDGELVARQALFGGDEEVAGRRLDVVLVAAGEVVGERRCRRRGREDARRRRDRRAPRPAAASASRGGTCPGSAARARRRAAPRGRPLRSRGACSGRDRCRPARRAARAPPGTAPGRAAGSSGPSSQSRPSQREDVDRLGRGVGLHARAVEVFDPQHDVPAALPGQRPVHQERAGVAQVQGAGGRRGESGARHRRAVRLAARSQAARSPPRRRSSA